jgi:hypothetical protein
MQYNPFLIPDNSNALDFKPRLPVAGSDETAVILFVEASLVQDVVSNW